jgi:hypothetical protein
MNAALLYKIYVSSFWIASIELYRSLRSSFALPYPSNSTHPRFRLAPTSTMHVLYALLPLLPLAAANGRIHFNAFGEPRCSGFEETYSLNPAPVKGNFPGKA